MDALEQLERAGLQLREQAQANRTQAEELERMRGGLRYRPLPRCSLCHVTFVFGFVSFVRLGIDGSVDGAWRAEKMVLSVVGEAGIDLYV